MVSQPSLDSFSTSPQALTGWLHPFLLQDNTDPQFRTFRNGLPSLLALATAYLTSSYAHSYYLSRKQRNAPIPPSTPHPSAPYQRIPFLVISSLVILFILHGISAFKILLLLYLNYKSHSWTGNSKITPYAIWAFNIAMLFSNEIFRGYQLGDILPELAFLVNLWIFVDCIRRFGIDIQFKTRTNASPASCLAGTWLSTFRCCEWYLSV